MYDHFNLESITRTTLQIASLSILKKNSRAIILQFEYRVALEWGQVAPPAEGISLGVQHPNVAAHHTPSRVHSLPQLVQH